MNTPPKKPEMETAIRELRTIAVFADLPEQDLVWLAERMEEIRLEAGEVYAREGDPIDYLNVMMEGELQFERTSDPGSPVFTARAGQVTGLLPFSRMTKFMGLSRAVRGQPRVPAAQKSFSRIASTDAGAWTAAGWIDGGPHSRNRTNRNAAR